MINEMTKTTLRVARAEPYAGFISLPESRLEEVCERLDKHQIHYSVDEYTISMDGEPATALIHLTRETDTAVVQSILDSIP